MTLVHVVFNSLTTVHQFLSTRKILPWGSSMFFHHQPEKDFDLDQLCFILAIAFCFFQSTFLTHTLTHFPFSWTTRILQSCTEAGWGNSQPGDEPIQPLWAQAGISPGTHLVILPFSVSLEHLEGDTCQETLHVTISAENRGQLLTFLLLFLKKHVGSDTHCWYRCSVALHRRICLISVWVDEAKFPVNRSLMR